MFKRSHHIFVLALVAVALVSCSRKKPGKPIEEKKTSTTVSALKSTPLMTFEKGPELIKELSENSEAYNTLEKGMTQTIKSSLLKEHNGVFCVVETTSKLTVVDIIGDQFNLLTEKTKTLAQDSNPECQNMKMVPHTKRYDALYKRDGSYVTYKTIQLNKDNDVAASVVRRVKLIPSVQDVLSSLMKSQVMSVEKVDEATGSHFHLIVKAEDKKVNRSLFKEIKFFINQKQPVLFNFVTIAKTWLESEEAYYKAEVVEFKTLDETQFAESVDVAGMQLYGTRPEHVRVMEEKEAEEARKAKQAEAQKEETKEEVAENSVEEKKQEEVAEKPAEEKKQEEVAEKSVEEKKEESTEAQTQN